MAVLIASDLHKDIAGRPLLRGVSFKLERRERMTIAGRNGAGKTTLLRMLAGEQSIDRGELSVAKGVRVALHDQRPPRERGMSLRDYVLSGCAQELAIEAELAELERRMGEGFAAGNGERSEDREESRKGSGASGSQGDRSYEAVLERYARAQGRLEALGGYRWRDRATTMTHGLGFAEADLERKLDTFSGGQLTRASLARALATGADVLLLDEPTNHLDIESLEWLEQTLVGLDAAVALVAHDRWFLEAVGTSVLELDSSPPAPRSRYFAGTWHNWRREQAARELALGKAIERQQAEIARMERFIERFRYKATKARQAQSRVKKLAKMERIERGAGGPESGRGLEFAFKAPERSGRVIFELQDARVEIGGDSVGGRSAQRDRSAGERPAVAATAGAMGAPVVLLEEADLWLERGEHVSLVGPNGSGKTTLIETLAGRRALAAGKLSQGHNVKVGYLSQHADELGAGGDGMPAHPNPSVLEAAQRATGLTPNKARALLGRFLFSGEEAEKPLAGLSGGELRRLSLAVLVGSDSHPPNVLILDEPTNHLDIESREALEDALRAFPGAVLLVSHDRALLDAVGTRTVAIEQRALRSYLGGWPEYVRVREERRAAGEPLDGGVGTPSSASSRSARTSEAGAAERGGEPDASEAKRGEARVKRGEARVKGGEARVEGGAARVKPKPQGPSKNRLREQRKAEREVQRAETAVEQAEAALRAVEDELGDAAAWATRYEAAKSEARHTAARRAVEDAYARLEALVE